VQIPSSESSSDRTNVESTSTTPNSTGSGDNKEEKAPRLCALVLGATGQIGKYLVGDILAHPQWERVVTIGRRKVEIPDMYKIDVKKEEESGRFVQHTGIEFDTDEKFKAKTAAYFEECPFVFSCLGTTRKDAGSAEAFRKIDLHYVKSGAELAKKANAFHFGLVTSQGANPKSWLLYTQTKGEIEEECKKLKFPSLGIFRPGLLDRGEKARFVEKLAGAIVTSIHVKTVASAIRVEAEQKLQKRTQKFTPWEVYHNDEINKFAKQSESVQPKQPEKPKDTTPTPSSSSSSSSSSEGTTTTS